MTEEQGYYEVGLSRNTVYVRVIGLATMYNAACVRDFVERLLAEGYHRVLFDLERCAGMDSTFMGVLAGVATFEGPNGSPQVTVLNADPSNVGLLEGVGLTHLLQLHRGHVDAPDIDLVSLRERTREEDRMELVRDAHERLIEVNPKNEAAFGAFLQALKLQMDADHRSA